MIKVLIADDHAVVLEGLKQILSETPDIIVSAQATNGQEVLDKIEDQQCRCRGARHRNARPKRVGYVNALEAGATKSPRVGAERPPRGSSMPFVFSKQARMGTSRRIAPRTNSWPRSEKSSPEGSTLVLPWLKSWRSIWKLGYRQALA